MNETQESSKTFNRTDAHSSGRKRGERVVSYWWRGAAVNEDTTASCALWFAISEYEPASVTAVRLPRRLVELVHR